MCTLLNLISEYKTLSIIGMDKNVGKTTTLNHILSEAKGIKTLGLTSVGRDGEEVDRVTATEKPKIYVEKGSVIATAKSALFNSDITREILETTGINTPMGEIVIVRAISDGFVDLAGPSVAAYVKETNRRLLKYGADMVLVDGALSRKSLASPSTTEATILATGASLNRNLMNVVDETVYAVKLLTTEKTQDSILKELYRSNMEECRVALVDEDYNVDKLDVLTAMQSSKEIREKITDKTKFIFVKGVISDKFINDLLKSREKLKGITFLVEDGTKIFGVEESLAKLRKIGGKIEVINPINIACITINPISPYGYEFNKDKFIDSLRERLDLPVFNVLELV